MKPPPFLYEAPHSLAEAVATLAEHGEDAKVLAGGQSLIPLLSMRLARPSALIDLNGVLELASIELNGATTIGSMTRHRTVERSADVTRLVPLLAAAVPHIGHAAIRTRGTIGGSLAHADPAAELPAVALALDATFRAAQCAAAPARSPPSTSSTATSRPRSSPTRSSRASGSRTQSPAPASRCRRWPAATATSRWWPWRCRSRPSGDVRIALINVADRPVRAIDAEAALRAGAVRSRRSQLSRCATSIRRLTCTPAPRTGARSPPSSCDER